jgi:hypothetical protein
MMKTTLSDDDENNELKQTEHDDDDEGELSETSNQELLHAVIIEHSISKEWQVAKTEWDLLYIYDRRRSCVCGHVIVENCVIRNRNTLKELTVGNVCINHFGEAKLEVPHGARQSLKRLRATPTTSNATSQLLEIAVRTGILYDGERNFYVSQTTGKGSRNRYNPAHLKYDGEAVAFRSKINRFILLGFAANRPLCLCRERAKPRQNSKTKALFYGCHTFPLACTFTQSV